MTLIYPRKFSPTAPAFYPKGVVTPAPMTRGVPSLESPPRVPLPILLSHLQWYWHVFQVQKTWSADQFLQVQCILRVLMEGRFEPSYIFWQLVKHSIEKMRKECDALDQHLKLVYRI